MTSSRKYRVWLLLIALVALPIGCRKITSEPAPPDAGPSKSKATGDKHVNASDKSNDKTDKSADNDPSSPEKPTVAPPNRTAPLKVVCTTGQIGDMLANLGGKHVAIETLMGPTVDPHLYKATLADSRRLDEAEVVFYNGLHLEGRITEVLENLAQRKPAFAVSEGVRTKTPERLRKLEGSDEGYDPHIWFDVDLWSDCTAYTIERLAEVDPAHADDYRANGKAYIAQLKSLHDECKQSLAEIPKGQRVMVTAHDAFGYFGKAYDVEVHGLQGVSTVDEAAPANIAAIVDLLVKRKVNAIFVESSVPEKNVKQVVAGCAKRGHKVTIPANELLSDALDVEGKPGATYIGMVRYNVQTIVAALKGE